MRPPSKTCSLRLRLQAQPASAGLLRQRLSLWLDELGANDDEIFDILLAGTEAFANAVEHPHEPRVCVIDVEGSISEDAITLTFRDHGSWRERRQREEGGFGFPLMRQLMGRIEVRTQPDGTAITMERKLARQRSSTDAGTELSGYRFEATRVNCWTAEDRARHPLEGLTGRRRVGDPRRSRLGAIVMGSDLAPLLSESSPRKPALPPAID